jgi:hypothetical protein
MMKEEDLGFGKNGKPTGYLKLETKENKAKALVHIQNVGQVDENHVLKAYLLSGSRPKAKPLPLGAINLIGDSGDASCEFSKEDVQRLGLDIQLMDTIIIECKNTVMENGINAFPLVGFEKQRWNWKDVFMDNKTEPQAETHNFDGKEVLKEVKQPTIDKAADEITQQSTDEVMDEVMNKVPDEITQQSMDEPVDEQETFKIPVGFVWNKGQIEKKDSDEDDIKEKEHEDANTHEENLKTDATSSTAVPSDWEVEQKYLEETMKAFERSFNTQDKKVEKDKAVSDEIQKFNHHLSRYAVAKQPYTDNDLGFKWWTINDCSFILNNLYSNHAITFSLYNPYVIRLVRRYGYFLFGMKEDEKRNVKHIAYAVPSRYATEPHPLLNLQAYAYWVPKNGERNRIGALGYWIICADVEKGDFISFNA